jgi:hypothetical protein
MKLFIRIVDGKSFEHPIMEMNFRSAFPNIDVNNLPPEFAEFVRHPQPEIGVYQIYQGVNYEWIDGKVQDVHMVRDMIESERQDKINFVKNQWQTGGGYPSWIFNEEECRFDPPVPYPEGDEIMVWDEPTLNWKPIPAQTIEGK